ncbi:MAG: enoyl-CoA hydratase/isomerase family protein [Planctomycetota bacterium]|nr:enoyl-CoA hydratase/isomerase family protein [Planctomycetota bacterium]MDG1984983.1 enoyl-CoA hydratase/isomerase family protein [Planctomycetota bacterium]
MIERHDHGEVLLLKLAHGKASALDLELLQELCKAIDEFEASGARACVLTGTGSIFSAGVDLKRLLEGGPDYIDAFLPALDRAMSRLLFSDRPLVTACNGHAIAGGCLIACCGDRRLGARGKGRVGVPELAVGVPFPPLAVELVRFSVGARHLQRALYDAAVHSMEDALQLGFIDELVEAEELEERALEAARQLAAIPPTSFAYTKRRTREVLRGPGLDPAAAAEVRALWASQEIHAALTEYVARTLR